MLMVKVLDDHQAKLLGSLFLKKALRSFRHSEAKAKRQSQAIMLIYE
jgi:hypothetical protein